jgi:hypothetical protein
VATTDQDVVDEIGRALGVDQEPDAEVRTSDELLRARDHDRWSIELRLPRPSTRSGGGSDEG